MTKILVVDDNPTMTILMSRVVEKLGYETLKAPDGFAALKLLSAESPDAVLLDVMMPGMTGLEVLDAMQQDPELRLIPVILVTARGDDEDVIRGLESGAHDYVTKPFKIEVLSARTRSAVRIRQNQQRLQQANEQLHQEMENRQKMERELAQVQKLEAVGHLAAGIAHEINTPAQYISGNMNFLLDVFSDIEKLLAILNCLVAAARANDVDQDLIVQAERLIAQADVDYIKDEAPKAIQQSLDGIEQVADIIRAMKDFSSPGGTQKQCADLRQCIQSTLTISHNQWQPFADVVTEFDPDLPPIFCYAGDLNQVILSLLVNAAHAIEDNKQQADARGRITISTHSDGDWAEFRISDTGIGIPTDIQDKVFNPFFTTRDVGKGRGQGLSLARSLVVDKHGGTICFESRQGEGTTFIVRLPIMDHDAEVTRAGQLVVAVG